ncbi:MAG: Major facilitator superfamily 1 [Thermoleophilia bacterium]|nr:Major facilitator superfamily 1 [Thermoleophilia bacterium]
MFGGRFVERLVPARLGRDFRWLLGATWATNLGDGIALAAGPLLVASLTSDPLLVALAATLQWLPPLVLGLPAGAISDRVERRRIVVAVNLARTLVLSVLALSVATDHVTVTVVLVALLLMACCEVFVDNGFRAMLPSVVARDHLGAANARQQTAFITVNQLAGPPVGAALFALGAVWPVVAQGVLVAFGALLVSRITRRPPPKRSEPAARMRHDIAEGLRWTMAHPPIRTLTLTIFAFNITFGAAWSVLVLYATDHLGMGAVGFGLLTATSAVGGLIGTASYGWITRHLTLGSILRIGLVVETLTHAALALTTSPWVALPIFFVFGGHAFIWATTSITVRQRAVPAALQGRVDSVNTVGVFGGLVLGSGLGGLLARAYGVTAPFWFAFVGSAIFVVLVWGQLRHVEHAD